MSHYGEHLRGPQPPKVILVRLIPSEMSFHLILLSYDARDNHTDHLLILGSRHGTRGGDAHHNETYSKKSPPISYSEIVTLRHEG